LTPGADLLDDLERYLELLEYELALQEAEDDLLRFCEVTMPEARKPDDPHATRYKVGRHHRLMAETMMAVERGEKKKIILNLPPRHGKSELCTKRFCAWFSARHPELDIIVATYNEKFAADFALEVRAIMSSPRFRQVFPEFFLTEQSAERLVTYCGGKIYFLGRRSSTTGRGANLILVDDPTKDDKEIRSPTFREDCWQWFTQTLLSRRHDDKAAMVVTQTRWHEDDIVGRITDKTNPAYAEKFAKGFEVINLPAIAEENDPLGRKAGEALWPERFGIEYLEEMRDANSLSFAALYQCDPTPEDGVFYRPEEIHEYEISEMPESLTFYVASDHGVSTASHNDPSCLVPFGVCPNGIAWIMPDIVWRRMDTKEAVSEMIEMIRRRKPVFWYAERGHISRAIGPFLRDAMEREGVYCPIIEDHPVVDKLQRAQSGRAKAATGRIRFPKWAPWWGRARSDLLKFPNGRFDDFPDVISTIGNKIGTHAGPARIIAQSKAQPGTFGYMLEEFRKQDRRQEYEAARSGW
jgi:predicted phage terminase large subunit-like protein